MAQSHTMEHTLESNKSQLFTFPQPGTKTVIRTEDLVTCIVCIAFNGERCIIMRQSTMSDDDRDEQGVANVFANRAEQLLNTVGAKWMQVKGKDTDNLSDAHDSKRFVFIPTHKTDDPMHAEAVKYVEEELLKILAAKEEEGKKGGKKGGKEKEMTVADAKKVVKPVRYYTMRRDLGCMIEVRHEAPGLPAVFLDNEQIDSLE